MRRSPHPRVDLEIAVVRLCHRPRAELIETVLERLEQAEARLRGYGGSRRSRPARSSRISSAPRPSRRSPGRWRCRGPSSAPRRRPRAAARAASRPRRSATRRSWRARRARRRVPGARRRPGRPSSPRSSASGRRSGTSCPRAWSSGRRTGALTVSVPNGSAFAHDQIKRPENRELVLETARRVQPGLRDVAFTAGGRAGRRARRHASRGPGGDGAVRGRDHPGPCRPRAARERARGAGGRGGEAP